MQNDVNTPSDPSEVLSSTATDEEVRHLFFLCLGRAPNDSAVASKRGMKLSEVLGRFLTSDEFNDRVLPTIGSPARDLALRNKAAFLELCAYLEQKLAVDTFERTLTDAGALSALLEKDGGIARRWVEKRRPKFAAALLDKLAEAPARRLHEPPLTKTSASALTLLFLGRSPNARDDLESRLDLGPSRLARHLLFSAESNARLVQSIVAGERLPHEHIFGHPPAEVLSSAADCLPLEADSREKVRAAKDWYELLRAVFSDPCFSESCLQDDPDYPQPIHALMLERARRTLSAGDTPQPIEAVLEGERTLAVLFDRPLHGALGLSVQMENGPIERFVLAHLEGSAAVTKEARVELSDSLGIKPGVRARIVAQRDETPPDSGTSFETVLNRSSLPAWGTDPADSASMGGRADALLQALPNTHTLGRNRARYARLLALRGAFEDARALLRVTAKEDPYLEEAVFARGGLAVQARQFAEASKDFGECELLGHRVELSRLLANCTALGSGVRATRPLVGVEAELAPFLMRVAQHATAPAPNLIGLEPSKREEAAWLCLQASAACFAKPDRIWDLLQAFVRPGWISVQSCARKAAQADLLAEFLPVLAGCPTPAEVGEGTVQLQIAKYLEALSQPETATAFAVSAASAVPAVPLANQIAGVMLQRQGRLSDASEHLNRVVEQAPDDIKAWERLGALERTLLLRDGARSPDRLKRAVRALTDSAAQRLATDPSDSQARLLLARAMILAERYAEAQSILVQLWESDTDPSVKSRCVRDLASVTDKLGLADETETWTRIQHQTEPSARTAVALAKALRATDKLEEANDVLNAPMLDVDLSLAQERARNLFFMGRFREAASEADEWIKSFPSDPQLRLYSATAHLEAGDVSTALVRAASLALRSDPLPMRSDLHLVLFDLFRRTGDMDSALRQINTLFSDLGCQDIGLKDAPLPLFDRLQGTGSYRSPRSHRPVVEGPLVSVIMTAYNAQDHIVTAVRSMLDQSYQNLEVIVVDDASTDATPDLLVQLEEQDPRVQAVLRTTNSGTYVSKNEGLLRASGEFVAFQDSDDWSHPDRLAATSTFLQNRPDVVGLTTDWLRMTTEGDLIIKAGAQVCHVCCISLVFRRKPVMQQLGFFDSVRIEADMEFIRRMRLVFGAGAVPRVRWPLLFGRAHGASLTASSEFGLTRTGFTQPRLEYQSHQRKWHRRIVEGESAFMHYPLTARRFLAPELMLPSYRKPEA